MVKNIKKFRLSLILLFFVSIALFAFGMAGISKTAASAEESAFKMRSGASVRLTEGETGIRFLAYVPEPTENDETEYRMLIVPEKLLTTKNIEENFVNALKEAYPEQAADWENNFWDKAVTPYYSEQLESYVVSGALGVSDAHKNEKFCGIAYYMNGENFVYADYNQNETIFDNARSVSYVASLALNSGDTYTETQTGYLCDYVSAAIPSDGLAFDNKNMYASKIDSVINASLNNEYQLDFKYEVADSNVVTVEAGKIVVKNFGETTVTAKIGNAYSAKITVGCPTDAQLFADATVPDQGINIYHRMGTVATPADESAPEGFENSLKYVLTPGAVVDTGNYYGYPVAFDNLNKYYTAYANRFSVADWSDAYITFKIYNAGTTTMKIGLTKGMDKDTWWVHSTETVEVGVNESKEVVLSVKSAMGITENVFEMEAFKNGARFNIMSYNSFSGVTEDNLADFAQTIYISDFDIVNISQAQKVRNVLLGKFAKAGTPSGGTYGNTGPYMYHFGLLSDSVSTNVVKETDASIKYVMTAESTSNASRYAAAIKLTKAELERIAELSECENFDTATISFWVRNDFATALDVRLYCSEVSIDTTPLVTKTTVANGEWALVEIDVSKMMDNLNKGFAFSISFYYGTGKTGMANGATFYLDGFKVYNK